MEYPFTAKVRLLGGVAPLATYGISIPKYFLNEGIIKDGQEIKLRLVVEEDKKKCLQPRVEWK